jgi:hypothetical protein
LKNEQRSWIVNSSRPSWAGRSNSATQARIGPACVHFSRLQLQTQRSGRKPRRRFAVPKYAALTSLWETPSRSIAIQRDPLHASRSFSLGTIIQRWGGALVQLDSQCHQKRTRSSLARQRSNVQSSGGVSIPQTLPGSSSPNPRNHRFSYSPTQMQFTTFAVTLCFSGRPSRWTWVPTGSGRPNRTPHPFGFATIIRQGPDRRPEFTTSNLAEISRLTLVPLLLRSCIACLQTAQYKILPDHCFRAT